jgi:hypothetical protein
VASATLYLWRTAESGAQRLEDELRATVAADLGLPPDPRSGQDDRDLPAPAATVQVQGITFHGNVASVLVETRYGEPDGRTFSARQRTFYQPTETGWLRVPPNNAYLGAAQIHETAFFTFFYHEVDAAAVEAVAAELDAVYTGLRKDYGLPPATGRMVIELVTAPPPDQFVCRQPNHLCIDSPALVALPTGVSEIEALQLSILSKLVYRVRWDAIEEIEPFAYRWHYAAYALPRMQMRRHSHLLSPWQTDLVGWLYGSEERSPSQDEQQLAQELARLCATHQLLARQSIIAGVVPTHLCVAPPLWDLAYLANSDPPERLDQLLMADPPLTVSEVSWMNVLAFETLLDYVVAAYGRDALPALVDGFRHYEKWDALIPEVFDVSAKAFEAGWQAYLAEHYGMQP